MTRRWPGLSATARVLLPGILKDGRKPGVLLGRSALLGILISLPLAVCWSLKWLITTPYPERLIFLFIILFWMGMSWPVVLWMGAGFFLLFDAVARSEKLAAVLPLRGRWLLYLLCALLMAAAAGMPILLCFFPPWR